MSLGFTGWIVKNQQARGARLRDGFGGMSLAVARLAESCHAETPDLGHVRVPM
ncbi:MAG: hypothetical protein ACYTG0_45230 [Planctomycetota bacterium]